MTEISGVAKDLLEQWRAVLPPSFLGTQIGQLSGGLWHWPTLRNQRHAGRAPEECFAFANGKTIVLRDVFLNWWFATRFSKTPPAPPGGYKDLPGQPGNTVNGINRRRRAARVPATVVPAPVPELQRRRSRRLVTAPPAAP